MSALHFHRYRPQCALIVKGPEARDFLQGQFSNDVSALQVGSTVYGFWLDRKGKIVADSFVQRRAEEAYAAISYFCSEEAVFKRLDAYLIMEEVEIEKRTSGSRGLALWGSQARAIRDELGDLNASAEAGDAGIASFEGRRSRVQEAFEWVAIGEQACDRIEELNARFIEAGAREATADEVLALSIRSGMPPIGLGFGASDLPQDLGLVEAGVSFSKGCYLGQEVMARIRSMGRVRKRLVMCSSERSDTIGPEELPLDLFDENGQRQGQLRVWSAQRANGVGLAVVSDRCEGERLWAKGSPLEVARAGHGP